MGVRVNRRAGRDRVVRERHRIGVEETALPSLARLLRFKATDVDEWYALTFLKDHLRELGCAMQVLASLSAARNSGDDLSIILD